MTSADVRALFAGLLDRPDVSDDDTFVSLGGDSLSYVEMSVRLEQLLGELPRDWHVTPIGRLAPALRRRRGSAVDVSVLLRAAAIVLVVGSHANLFFLQGGAHLLLVVAGYNLARFQLTARDRAARNRHVLTSLARVVVPSAVWIGAVAVVVGTYGVPNVLMLNWLLGPDTWTVRWQFWFLETLVWSTAAAAAVLAVPVLDRAERRAPFAFATGVLASTLAVRYALTGVQSSFAEHYTPLYVAWFIALGWAVARAAGPGQRLLVTVAGVVAIHGFFGDPVREAVVIVGVVLLVWVPRVRLPQPVARLAGVLAASSLYVYLTHWQVYPHLEDHYPVLATLASFGVGISFWLLASRWLPAAVRRQPGIPANGSCQTPVGVGTSTGLR